MIVKGNKSENHARDQRKAFDVLEKFGMRLNADKCVFGVTTRKFIDFRYNTYIAPYTCHFLSV